MYDQSNPKVFGEMLKRVRDLGSRYYVNAEGGVMLYWNGTWKDYAFVAQRDKRYVL